VKYLLTAVLVTLAVVAISLWAPRSVEAQERDNSQPVEPGPGNDGEDEGSDEDELEMLKRAWKRHQEEKKEENPSGRGSEQQDPLEAIAGKMKLVERKLVQENVGKETQDKEDEILNLLDDLIKKAEEAQQQSSSSQQQQQQQQKQQQQQQQQQQQKKMTDPSRSSQPAQPNMQRQKQILQKVGQAEKKDIKWRGKGGSSADRWGFLPGHVNKEDVKAGSEEKFPEKYRELLENYYKQLGKERPDSGK
jgi:hypothetical protein